MSIRHMWAICAGFSSPIRAASRISVRSWKRIGISLDKDDPRLNRVLEEVKRKESQGYAYEGADASFYLLVKRVLGEVPGYFLVDRFSVNVERRYNAVGDLTTVAEAIVKVMLDGEVMISAAEGNGPVNALDVALRKDLGKYQRFIDDLELVDYKVRVFQGGTDAVTRVLIESRDRDGDIWATVGVSPNIIDASFEALLDSIVYKLVMRGAPGLNGARVCQSGCYLLRDARIWQQRRSAGTGIGPNTACRGSHVMTQGRAKPQNPSWSPVDGPLSGLRIIELDRFHCRPDVHIAWPSLGAEVIRLDAPEGGSIIDAGRWRNQAPAFTGPSSTRGNARSPLDLRREEARERAAELICAPGEGNGIFVTNLPLKGRPHLMKR